jgi:hypothetical protein
MEVGECQIGTVGKMMENSPIQCCQIPLCADWCAVWRCPSSRRIRFIFLFGWTLRIRCFNFLNIYTYRNELVVAPLSKNFTNKVPSISQKTLGMALPAEICTLNFFVRGDERGCHSNDCLFINGS